MAFLQMPLHAVRSRNWHACRSNMRHCHLATQTSVVGRTKKRYVRLRLAPKCSSIYGEDTSANSRPVAMDYAALAHCVAALSTVAVPARVENVLQPAPTSLVLLLRTLQGSFRLILSFSQTHGRLVVVESDFNREYSEDSERRMARSKRAPRYALASTALSLLFSTALVSASIATAFDRVAKLTFAPTPTSEPCAYIFLELLGNGRSNLALTDASLSIKACGKQIAARSAARSFQTGSTYYPPPPPPGIDPGDSSMRDSLLKLAEENRSIPISKLLVRYVAGVSPGVAKMICSRAFPALQSKQPNFNDLENGTAQFSWIESITTGLRSWNDLHKHVECVHVLENAASRHGFSLEIVELVNRSGDTELFELPERSNENLKDVALRSGHIIEKYYSEHERQQSLQLKSSQLRKAVRTSISRAKSRAASYQSKVDECNTINQLKQDAEFLFAYAHTWCPGDGFVTGEWMDSDDVGDVSDSSGARVDIRMVSLPEDKRISPTELASQFYKKAGKLERARSIAQQFLDDALSEIDWLEGVGVSINMARSDLDLLEIENDLEDTKMDIRNLSSTTNDRTKKISKGKRSSSKKKANAKFSAKGKSGKRHSEGKAGSGNRDGAVGVLRIENDDLEILVGRNAKGNENVTFALSRKEDLWLHAAGTGGAHVVARLKSGKSISEIQQSQLQFAADIAAFFSQSSNAANVPVTVLPARDVRRAPGSPRRLGSVVLPSKIRTVYAKPHHVQQEACIALDSRSI